MNVQLHHRISKRSWTGRADEQAIALTAPVLMTEPPAVRERDADRVEDRALYHCHCGYVFQAPVSTSVGCPHCGSAQAW
ncbi:hypothetical protein [Conexibacter arvalis]|uniref:Uncharacterized protein n=1 Tax=Conexibacter arvalis TaxID=912552 RepID=A0A840IKT9_9ACTN|nr:hypothetical protein [Conexibacter arvalis]MBB4664558.1 hypothetical protein [Conexibacter arvalis]